MATNQTTTYRYDAYDMSMKYHNFIPQAFKNFENLEFIACIKLNYYSLSETISLKASCILPYILSSDVFVRILS